MTKTKIETQDERALVLIQEALDALDQAANRYGTPYEALAARLFNYVTDRVNQVRYENEPGD